MASGEALPRGNPDWQALQRLLFSPAAARKSPTRWNFAPWADFRTYMDISLARTLDDLRRAARSVDPKTPVGIEGTQMPHAFGGYDLWRLARALDWVEPYDIGSAREIFGSFMPGKAILTTVFETQTDQARRRLWHLLLEGDRGCIIWWSEDCIDWNSPDWALTRKACALKPVLHEMTGPLARVFLRARRLYDPVRIVYSQPSIQADWLIESCVDGSTWLRRFSSHEAAHNRAARARNAWTKSFRDLGFSPRFLGPDELASEKWIDETSILVLPTALALSDHEIKAVRSFLAGADEATRRVVFADGAPGVFDHHATLRRGSPLDVAFPLAAPEETGFAAHGLDPRLTNAKTGDISEYSHQRAAALPRLEWIEWVRDNLGGLEPEVTIPKDARASVYRYALGDARLIAIERNISYTMSEDLKQAGGNQNLEKPVELVARFRQMAHLYDLRTPAYLGYTNRIAFTLDPWHPSLFAVMHESVPAKCLIECLIKMADRATSD